VTARAAPAYDAGVHRPTAAVLALALAAGCSGGPKVSTPPLPAPHYDPVLACSGAAGAGFTSLQIGFTGSDVTAAKPGFDLRYQYIAGVLAPDPDCLSSTRTNALGCGSAWWGTWQYNQDPPGAFVRSFVSGAERAGLLPMLTYYVILPAARDRLGIVEGDPEVSVAATNATFMASYLDDFRFFLRQIGTAPAIVHVEPDFWGYAQNTGSAPSDLFAAVHTANSTDCGAFPDTIAGLGQCLQAMTRTYAPNALFSLHGSPWATLFDCVLNTDPHLDVAAKARATADFLVSCAPAADLIVVDIADRDAAYYGSIGRNIWLDPTDATLPSFAQAFRWSRALRAQAGKPLLWWQVPVGNGSLDDGPGAWRDNRVEYFFAHPDRVAGSGAVGVAFGAGADGQTTPESDRGYLWSCAAALHAAGGQPLCP
jgi:hypothetical protein